MDDKKKIPVDDKVINEKQCKKQKGIDENSVLYKSFMDFKDELDRRNDKYERLVVMSRDTTIQSKRVIFGLLQKNKDISKKVFEAKERIKLIQQNVMKIGVELENEDAYKFARSFSPGFQEFIEAVSLLHYIETKQIISYADVNNLYFQYNNKHVLLTPFDYMLGMADLTGELMRMAINSISEGAFEQVDEICVTLRIVHNEFSKSIGCHREMSKKASVMKSSVEKVENACYMLKVRGSEVPTHMIQDLVKDHLQDSLQGGEC